jgi:Animal haem peroxidase
MKRHGRASYYVVGEGVLTADQNGNPIVTPPSDQDELRQFRFSRLGPQNEPVDDAQRQVAEALANAMTGPTDDPDSGLGPVAPPVPAGFTYLGQFVDHDLTLDATADQLGQDVSLGELVEGRSPALDLDSVYGRGPRRDPRFYAADGVHLKTGTTVGVPFPAGNPAANTDQPGFDLPRVGQGPTKAARRTADIPDVRNDENLAVAQTHTMFIRFHNTAVDKLAGRGVPNERLFDTARPEVVKHYQWMLRTDLLPRLVEPAIVDDVFTNGRRFFEAGYDYDPSSDQMAGYQQGRRGNAPTIPVEFAVAAYRLGHSMVRAAYQWNAVFNSNGGPGGIAPLHLLFQFSGTSGVLSPSPPPPAPPLDLDDPDAGTFERLPSNWIADFRRLYDFTEAGRGDLTVPAADFNVAKRVDTLLVDPLRDLPRGAFGGRGAVPPADGRALNLAFRNLTRAEMIRLASGQQMADFFGVERLKPDEILNGASGVAGAALDALTEGQKSLLAGNTPLWFYILREAELNNGRLAAVGGRIVAEVFHRAMEGSTSSIVRDPAWRPSFGPDRATFRMVDLLLFAVDGDATRLAPLG